MSIFTVAECDEIIQALKTQLIEDPSGALGSVTVGSRTVTYRSAEDLEKLINFWARQKSQAQAAAAGRGRVNISVAKFS